MARQLVALKRAISGSSDRATQAGFLITYLIMLGALAHRLPLFHHEAQITGQALIGREVTFSFPVLTGMIVRISDSFLPDVLTGRGPFVLASFLGAVLHLRIARHMATGPVVANLGLAWALSSLLLLGGGALIGPGPLALMGVALFMLSVTRLIGHTTRANWTLVAAAAFGMTAILPEMSAAVLALIGLPIFVPACRRWLLRAEFWLLIGSTLMLAVAMAGVNGLTLLWPMLSLHLPGGISALWGFALVAPPVLLAVMLGLTQVPQQAQAHPMRAVVYVTGLGLAASFVASGFKVDLLIAALPLLSLQAAHVFEARSDRLTTWLGENCLPFSAVAMLGAVYLWATANPLLMHNTPAFRDASGWTAVSLELEALARQNALGWIATDTPGHAAMIGAHLNGRLPIAVAGTDAQIDCRKGGLFMAQTHSFQDLPTDLRPILRVQDGQPRGTYVVSVIQAPQRVGLCEAR